ncbi:SatD family protein [Rathayibacter sp. AY1E6]|uniref:SatD family protein n=1 Tax=Rathayibacter sp. AY1E6 TaxID=2080554 RepID=UPI0015E44A27
MKGEDVFPVIFDIVRSREIPSRGEAQARIEYEFLQLDPAVHHLQPIRPTLGDEFQAVYETLSAALLATALACLKMPENIEIRAGIGRGPIEVLGEGLVGVLQDGPGWWSARTAVNEARRLQYTSVPSCRSWFVPADNKIGDDALVNAYLLSRDIALEGLSARARRIISGTYFGMSQKELSLQEKVSQPAISQILRRVGAPALLRGLNGLAAVE